MFSCYFVHTSLKLIIRLRFICGERKICSTIKKSQKYFEHDCLQNFILLFFLSTALIVKNSHTLPGIYFVFPEKRTRPSLKGFQYQI